MSGELLNRLLSLISDDYDKSAGSFIYDVTAPSAIVLGEIVSKLEEAKGKWYSGNLAGDELTLRAAEHGLTRKPAIAASSRIQVFGTGTVSVGDLFETEAGTQFKAIDTVSIAGSGYVLVEAVVAGNSGNVASSTITSMPVTLTGITAATNPEAASGGYDEESDESLRSRFDLQRQQRPASGNKAHYALLAREIPGIVDARVFRAWSGPGTVKVVLLSDNKRSPSAAAVSAARERILEEIQIDRDGAVTVVGVEEVMVSISATLTLRSGGTLATVAKQIQTTVTIYLEQLAWSDTVVRYNKIGEALLDAADVLDYANLRVNGGTANLELADDQVPVMGAVNMTLGV